MNISEQHLFIHCHATFKLSFKTCCKVALYIGVGGKTSKSRIDVTLVYCFYVLPYLWWIPWCENNIPSITNTTVFCNFGATNVSLLDLVV